MDLPSSTSFAFLGNHVQVCRNPLAEQPAEPLQLSPDDPFNYAGVLLHFDLTEHTITVAHQGCWNFRVHQVPAGTQLVCHAGMLWEVVPLVDPQSLN